MVVYLFIFLFNNILVPQFSPGILIKKKKRYHYLLRAFVGKQNAFLSQVIHLPLELPAHLGAG